ncbi:MAG: Maf family protein [Eggerthella lenta]
MDGGRARAREHLAGPHAVDRSAVTFRELTDEEIVDYLRRASRRQGRRLCRQEYGADLVARVDGAMDTVIGLPVGRLLEEFPDFAVGV